MTKFVLIISLVILTSCNSKKNSTGLHQVGGGETIPSPVSVAPGTAVQMTGSSSGGGGGYGSESGLYILERVKTELLQELELVNLKVFAQIKDSSFRQSLIDIISTLVPDDRYGNSPLKEVIRDGEELYFDNYLREDEKVIVATKLFFQSLAGFEYSELPEAKIVPKLRFFKVRVLHEAMHHLGVGVSKDTDSRARKAAEAIIYAIETNNLICKVNTTELPKTYFRFWQRYRVFDPIFKKYCLSQIETKAKDFFEDSGMMHTNGTRMDLQAKGEIVNQEMIWVINKPTGMGIYDPSYEPERNNNSSSELSEPKLESIKAGTFQFLKDYDSDQRREEESFPYYRFRSPMTFFSRYDFSLSSDAIYVDPKKYLDWQEVTSSDSGEIVYSSSAKASAFVVKSSDPITYSENFICDTQVYYESDREDLPLEPGEQLARNDIKVSESLTIVNSTKAKLKYDYTISSDQDFHLGPWQEPAMGDHEEGEFDLDCSEANSVLDHSLFTAD